MQTYSLQTPLTSENILQLNAGDAVLLTGTIYTARDAAHKKFLETLDSGGELPFPLEGAVIYYVGPTPAPPGRVIGSAGPTTSYRMDSFAPRLHSLGVKATIGKGKRNQEVKDALQEYRAVYLGATGGAGALLSKRIKRCEVIAFQELGPEAVRMLEVEDFPTLVVNDAYGNELYSF
ncbi:MAG: Fe-S-containing hydro-lyase [Thermodesulfobacteriota bacterium]